MMDAQEQLVWDSEYSAAVLGRGQAFLLLPLDSSAPEAVKRAARERGFFFCGVLAVKDGHAVAQPEPGQEAAETMLCASLAFALQIADKMTPAGDSTDWLEQLYRLPDARD